MQMQERRDLGRHVQMRHPIAVDGVRQTDVEVQPKRTCDLVGEIPAESAPLGIGMSNEFGRVPPERDTVVAMPRARRPGGGLRRQSLREPLGRSDIGKGQQRLDHRQPGLVGQQLPHGDRLLAALRELGPVVGHPRVIVQQSARNGQRDCQCGNTFCRRERIDQRVVRPRRPSAPVAETTPEVHDLAAVAIDRERGSDLRTAGQIEPKRVGDLSVALIDVTADRARARPWFSEP